MQKGAAYAMSVNINGEILVSKIHTDKKLGTWWAIGANRQWLELRVTKTGRIKPFSVHKGKHPYFTYERPKP